MELIEKIENKTAVVGIIGLGYVGLPLALEFAAKGYQVYGFELDASKVETLKQKKTYIKHISSEKIESVIQSGRLIPTLDFSCISATDAVIICVPTPLNEHREPDLSYVVNAARTASAYIKRGQVIILESTTYPGTTEEILLPMFINALKEKEELIETGSNNGFDGLFGTASLHREPEAGRDFYLAFSPEREDPNNPHFQTSTIPKVVGGVTKECGLAAKALYDTIIERTVPVSSARVAEAAKLLENIYRSVNIALVNELKIVLEKMNIDIWEVIEAASTKPFGFHPFYPGPGLGGHCIPIDPFYLTWKAREHDVNTKFIELAGEINTSMPYYVVERAMEELNNQKKSLNGSSVLILGASYKKDIDDVRESPSLKLIEILTEKGASVSYHDPYVPKLRNMTKKKIEIYSAQISPAALAGFDLVILSTDHTAFDYEMIYKHSVLILDTRNAFGARKLGGEKVVKA